MCVIVHNWFNFKFKKQELENFYFNNPDGTGLYYYNTNTKKETIKKWPKGTPFNDIWAVVNNLYRHNQIRNVALHFRYSTSGGDGYEQTHPIKVNNKICLMHNGVAPQFEWDKDVMSDTQCIAFWFNNMFNKIGIKSLTQFNDFEIQRFKNTFQFNKLLLLEADKFRIINEELGEWRDGIWYSFKSYSYYDDLVIC